MRQQRQRVAVIASILVAAAAAGSRAERVFMTVHAAAPPSTALQAELVAQLHIYTGLFKLLSAPEADASRKSIQVTGLSEATADGTSLYVRSIAVQLQETTAGAQPDILYGAARGQFRLGRITATDACVEAAPGSVSALTVTSLDIPHISGKNEYEAAKKAIAASFPEKVCVPLYPSIAIEDVGAEECVTSLLDTTPRSRTARFTVTLSNLSARTVTIHYAAADGSARAGADYTAVSGTLKIPSLAPGGAISVSLRCRPGDQGERAFTMNLSNPVNGVMTRRQAQGVIIDSRFGR